MLFSFIYHENRRPSKVIDSGQTLDHYLSQTLEAPVSKIIKYIGFKKSGDLKIICTSFIIWYETMKVNHGFFPISPYPTWAAVF